MSRLQPRIGAKRSESHKSPAGDRSSRRCNKSTSHRVLLIGNSFEDSTVFLHTQ